MASVDQVNVNVVEMIDPSTPFGATVDFGNKAKTRVITQINPREDASGKDVAMFWAFRNGKVVVLNFFVPVGGRPLAAEEQAHGIQQKIGDSYAQASEPDDVQMIVEMTLDNLLAGRWAKQSEGAAPGISGLTSDLIEGVRRTFAVNKEEYRDVEAGKALAKAWLIVKYNGVLDKANELRASGDEGQMKIADDLTKKPFETLLTSADLQRHLAAIKREKAELAEANKLKALETAGVNLEDFE